MNLYFPQVYKVPMYEGGWSMFSGGLETPAEREAVADLLAEPVFGKLTMNERGVLRDLEGQAEQLPKLKRQYLAKLADRLLGVTLSGEGDDAPQVVPGGNIT